MKLFVPTNWDNELIARIKDYPEVEWLYGAVTLSAVGSGRMSYLLPEVDRSQAEEHIKLAKANGIKFNYCINTSCMGNKEFTREGYRNIIDYLEWIVSTGAEAVTVALPSLLEIVKKHFPHLRACVSLFSIVDNLDCAKWWQDLGADEITLVNRTINRDFKMLRALKENINCELQLIASLTCLSGCPFAPLHANQQGHGTTDGDPNKNFFVEYCIVNCTLRKVKNPAEFIRAQFIRPEDIREYEAIGIERFKLCDRCMTTEALVRRVKAYSERRYDGNLAKILFTFTDPADWNPIKMQYLNHPELIDVTRLATLNQALFQEKLYIDNRKLDGFLDFFKNHDCRLVSCDKCGYCAKIAENAVRIDGREQAESVKLMTEFLDGLISGEFFNSKEGA